MEMFRYLHYGLSAILVFVGVKMILSGFFHIPVGIALGTVALILGASVIASILARKREPRREEAEVAEMQESEKPDRR
jgi:tellurite resistance protein TerC